MCSPEAKGKSQNVTFRGEINNVKLGTPYGLKNVKMIFSDKS